jgi:hypothetical protein
MSSNDVQMITLVAEGIYKLPDFHMQDLDL